MVLVGAVETETGQFRVTWRIANFMSLPEEINSYYTSPDFYFLNTRWFLKIYPYGQLGNEGWVGLHLESSSQGPPESVSCIFGIRRADGNENLLIAPKDTFSRENSRRGFSKFLRRSYISRLPEIVASGVLTVICTLCSDLEDQSFISTETQTGDLEDGITKEEVCACLDIKDGAILSKHFQDLLLKGKDHDVTLKVKDQQFRAHKCVLRARSPVFAAMFAHNTAENESGEVSIEDCDPKAFCKFLNYVYVGKFENMSPATAASLYYIADKYDFPDLKETCVHFLNASLTPSVVCDVVPLAINHGENELLECVVKFFSKHMQETFMTVKWQRFIKSNPILANELNIKAMDYFNKDGPPLKNKKCVEARKVTRKRKGK